MHLALYKVLHRCKPLKRDIRIGCCCTGRWKSAGQNMHSTLSNKSCTNNHMLSYKYLITYSHSKMEENTLYQGALDSSLCKFRVQTALQACSCACALVLCVCSCFLYLKRWEVHGFFAPWKRSYDWSNWRSAGHWERKGAIRTFFFPRSVGFQTVLYLHISCLGRWFGL